VAVVVIVVVGVVVVVELAAVVRGDVIEMHAADALVPRRARPKHRPAVAHRTREAVTVPVVVVVLVGGSRSNTDCG
jgi:hypothetical protein